MATLPPGPRGRLLPLWHYLRDPLGSTLRLFERYGDSYTTRAMGVPMVATRDPRLIRTILAADRDTYEAWGVDEFGSVLGEESLLVLSGERHRAARKLLMPPFAGARMRAYGRGMVDIARAALRGLPRGKPFAIQTVTQEISLQIILRAVFGVTEPDEVRRYGDQLTAAMDSMSPALMFIKPLRHEFGGLGPWAKLKRNTRAVERAIYAALAARRAAGSTGDDILSLVMAARYDDGAPMADRQLFETLMTIVVAGHETTAIAAAWACYFVHRTPTVRARLAAELSALADDAEPGEIAGLPYLGAVVDEALRIKPVAPSLVRVLKRPFELGGWTLPAGVVLNPSIVGLHYRPEAFPEPEVFRPERFLERDLGPDEYLPFGGGHRRCIGAAFAVYELKLMLATILREPTLRLVTDANVEGRLRSSVVGPARPIRFTLT